MNGRLDGIDGVLFDLDGTLYSTPPLFRMHVALGCGGDLGLLLGVTAVRRELAGRPFPSEAAFWEAHHTRLAHRCRTTAANARRFYDGRFLPSFVRTLRHHARPRPGLVELLQQLASRDVACCVLSDYEAVPERLEALSLGGLFRACASTAASGALKPAPNAYLAMAERLQIPPERWLVVGDRADTDQAGAAAAGMAFLGLGDSPGFEPWPQLAERLGALRCAASSP